MERLHIFLNGDRGMAVLEALVEKGHRLDGVYVLAKGSASASAYRSYRKPSFLFDIGEKCRFGELAKHRLHRG